MKLTSTRWMTFIDVDEFPYFPHGKYNLRLYLAEEVLEKGREVVCVPWEIYCKRDAFEKSNNNVVETFIDLIDRQTVGQTEHKPIFLVIVYVF